jgi:hypothetical protein
MCKSDTIPTTTTPELPAITTQPKEDWYRVRIPAIDGELHCGTRIYVPEHTVTIAKRYPTFQDGTLPDGRPRYTLISEKINGQDVTQKWFADFFRQYNQQHGTKYRLIPEFEDFWLRQRLGKKHPAFDENFHRDYVQAAYGYLADVTKQYKSGMIEGIEIGGNTQSIVQRRAFIYDANGELQELGITTFAPNGMVPRLPKTQLEKEIGSDGLKKLEKLLHISDICDGPDGYVNVRNPLGHAQLTFPHEYEIGGKLAPHNHHQTRPEQNDYDTAGVRIGSSRVCSDMRGRWRLCFYAELREHTGNSGPVMSSPLIYGDGKMKITSPNVEREISV